MVNEKEDNISNNNIYPENVQDKIFAKNDDIEIENHEFKRYTSGFCSSINDQYKNGIYFI